VVAVANRARTERRLLVLVAVVVALGGLSVLSAGLDHGIRHVPALWRLAVAAVALLCGDVAVLHVRFGDDQYSFTWSETAVVLGLVLLSGGWLRVVAPVCVALAHLLARRPWTKVAFNAASFATGCLLARIAFQLASGHATVQRPDQVGTWAALAVAAFVFFLWNGLSVAAAVSTAQDLPLGTVYRAGLGLSLLVWAGNTATGVLLVAIAASRPQMLVVLPVLVGLLYLAYRSYLRAMQERDLWEVLEQSSRAFIDLGQAEMARTVIARTGSLFRADFVELVLVEGEPPARATVYRRFPGGDVMEMEAAAPDLTLPAWSAARNHVEPFEVRRTTAPERLRRELVRLELVGCAVAPLVAQGRRIGILRMGFRGRHRLSARDRGVLTTFANHVSTSLHNARLFSAMNEERAKLRGVVDHSSDGIMSVGVDGSVTSWNPAMARITGVPAPQAMGAALFAGLPARDQDGAPVGPRWLQQRLAGVGQFEALISVETTGSGRRWLQLSAAAVPSAGDDGESAVVVCRDVTALREAEEAKQDFVATVSHELRTPLTPLKGFLMTLLRPNFNPEPHELHDFHSRMLRQAERLERLIEDLLSLSKMDAGQFSIDEVPVSVDEVVERVLQDAARPVRHARAGMAGLVVADPMRLEQVVANLVGNADKYSPPDGDISVSVERQGAEVVVRVRDQGPGIPEDQQERVFERFHRLGHHLTRMPNGAGLGLYIARRLVEAMGGRIWVESRLGEGSTFAFSLPAAPLVLTSGAQIPAPPHQLVALPAR
jgi:PAS domain S-box-containing protein